jgi:DNA-binding Lrp family transcriptional regulator
VTSTEKKVAQMIQADLNLSSRPFLDIGNSLGASEEQIISIIDRMKHQGVIRKIGAIIHHRKAGYERNFMVVWAIAEKDMDRIGRQITIFPEISHCYERKPPFLGRYSLFTMIHLKPGQTNIEPILTKLSEAASAAEYLVLASIEEFKKSSMEYFA